MQASRPHAAIAAAAFAPSGHIASGRAPDADAADADAADADAADAADALDDTPHGRVLGGRGTLKRQREPCASEGASVADATAVDDNVVSASAGGCAGDPRTSVPAARVVSSTSGGGLLHTSLWQLVELHCLVLIID